MPLTVQARDQDGSSTSRLSTNGNSPVGFDRASSYARRIGKARLGGDDGHFALGVEYQLVRNHVTRQAVTKLGRRNKTLQEEM